MTVDVFLRVADLSGLFSRSLRLSTLPLLEQHSPLPPLSFLSPAATPLLTAIGEDVCVCVCVCVALECLSMCVCDTCVRVHDT